jgi:hypothetical protein
MKNIGTSEVLILSSAVMSFVNMHLAITALALGTLGGIIRFSIAFNEKQEKSKEIEGATENFASILSGLASGMNSKDRDNLH